ncbi:MAG: hypothetical protein HQK49_11260 [Oligoflexia bacterium]|nr:hypothetical protein [Oligoflexia bacterium]
MCKKLSTLLLLLLSIIFIFVISSCHFVEKIEKKAKAINQYEGVSLEFAKENRQLKVEIGKLEFEIQNLKAKNSYLELKLKQNKISIDGIGPASASASSSTINNHGEKKSVSEINTENGNHHGEVAKLSKSPKSPRSAKSSRAIEKDRGRGIASVSANSFTPIVNNGNFNGNGHSESNNLSEESDPIGFELYNWKPEQLVTMANTSFTERDYVRATQYFMVLIREFPTYHEINDQLYFMAGVSAYNSGRYYNLAQNYLTTLISRYPSSSLYRGAKLWLALANFKMGNSALFFKTVDEFRLKYRNTQEWKILSSYYENYRNKYKK